LWLEATAGSQTIGLHRLMGTQTMQAPKPCPQAEEAVARVESLALLGQVMLPSHQAGAVAQDSQAVQALSAAVHAQLQQLEKLVRA